LALLTFLARWFWPQESAFAGEPIDRLVVHKSKRKMMVYAGNRLLKTYKISLGKNPVGHKEIEGDMRTPEGKYTINARNPNSSYYKNLGISYPNDADRAHAASLGKSAGGDIKIHGQPNGKTDWGRWHLMRDWTHGCIAVTNLEMEELYTWVIDGARIEILP